jgi:hypothetical protein
MAKAKTRARKQGTREGDRSMLTCRLAVGEGSGRFMTPSDPPVTLAFAEALKRGLRCVYLLVFAKRSREAYAGIFACFRRSAQERLTLCIYMLLRSALERLSLLDFWVLLDSALN